MKISDKMLKNITTILCGLFYLSTLLPFVGLINEIVAIVMKGEHIKADYSNPESYALYIKGVHLYGQTGVLGIILVLIPIFIILFNYISKLSKYRKIGSLVTSVVLLAMVIFTPIIFKLIFEKEAHKISFNYDFVIHHLSGFWIMLVVSLLLVAVSSFDFFSKNREIDVNAYKKKAMAIAKDATQKGKEISSKIVEQAQSTIDNGVNETKEKVVSAVENKRAERKTNAENDVFVEEKSTNNSNINYDTDTVIDQLKKLNELKEKGILSEEEFNEKKQKFLERL